MWRWDNESEGKQWCSRMYGELVGSCRVVVGDESRGKDVEMWDWDIVGSVDGE
jgi:hypothetical protein